METKRSCERSEDIQGAPALPCDLWIATSPKARRKTGVLPDAYGPSKGGRLSPVIFSRNA
jgi:hypothetical protein